MAERIQQLRRSDLGRLVVAQQTTEAAIDSLFEPVLVTDGEGKVTKLNRAAESLFGAGAKALGKPIAEIAHDQRIAMAVSEALAVGIGEESPGARAWRRLRRSSRARHGP